MEEMYLIILGGGITFIGSILTQLLVNWLNKLKEKRDHKRKILHESIEYLNLLEADLYRSYSKLENLKTQFGNPEKSLFKLYELTPIIQMIENELYSTKFSRLNSYADIFDYFGKKKRSVIKMEIYQINDMLLEILEYYRKIIIGWYERFLNKHPISIKDDERAIQKSILSVNVFHIDTLRKLNSLLYKTKKRVNQLVIKLNEYRMEL